VDRISVAGLAGGSFDSLLLAVLCFGGNFVNFGGNWYGGWLDFLARRFVGSVDLVCLESSGRRLRERQVASLRKKKTGIARALAAFEIYHKVNIK